MADDADIVSERELVADEKIHSFRYNIPVGKSGECEECGEFSKRLIKGLCAPCRDGK